MISFLLFYDLLYYISICFSIYQNIKGSFIVIIFQSLKFYFNMKRMNKYYPGCSVLNILYDHISLCLKKETIFFSPEGFQILEYLFNFVIIFDFIWFFILFKRKYKKQIIDIITWFEKDVDNNKNNILNDNNKMKKFNKIE